MKETNVYKKDQLGFEDVFGKLIADSTTNVLDIASHYPYNPERWRLFKNGSRLFPEYNSVAEYNHTGDIHELKPSGGDTITFETTERPRYVVQYGLAATWAFEVNQSLSTGDKIKVGLYDSTAGNGWYFEHNGSHSRDYIGDFVEERTGSEVYRKENIDIEKEVTTFARLRLDTPWYDIGRQEWERSYSNNGNQKNPTIGCFSSDENKGPKVGNLPLHFSVQADSNTSGLILEAGSCAQVNLGNTTQITRQKTFEESYTFTTTGSWVPMKAMRIDPDRKIVNTQIRNFEITEWGGADDVNIIIQSHAPEKVRNSNGNTLTDSDYSVPNVLNAKNSVIEISDNADQGPDSTGTIISSTSNPGGYQLGFASQRNQGKSSNKVGIKAKRDLSGRDTALIWGKADNAKEIVFNIVLEMDF